MALDKSIKLTGAGEAFMKELQELGKLEVAIGYQHGAATEKDGTDICDIAAWNELGTEPSGKIRGIPSRPFMRDSVNLHHNEILQVAGKAAQLIAKGGSAEEALKKIGLFQQDLMQHQITDGNYQENAKSTIEMKKKRRKKKSKQGEEEIIVPLIDTGIMRKSVNFQVRERSNS